MQAVYGCRWAQRIKDLVEYRTIDKNRVIAQRMQGTQKFAVLHKLSLTAQTRLDMAASLGAEIGIAIHISG